MYDDMPYPEPPAPPSAPTLADIYQQWLREEQAAGRIAAAPADYWIPPEAVIAGNSPSALINQKNPYADPGKEFVQAGTTGGYIDGIGVTIGQGRSTTPAEAQAAYNALVAEYGKDVADDWLRRNPLDYTRGREALATQIAGQGAGGQFIWGSGGSGFGGSGGFGEYTAGTYTPGQFREEFQAPTVEDMLKDPGYRARMDEMQRGTERMAAAKGSILSGGFVGRTLPRVLGEHASQEYGNTFKRAYDMYQQRYGQFSDAQAREANAFAMNETGKLNQYQTRYTSYRDLIKDRQYEEDQRWQREMDLARLGLTSATASR